MSFWKEFDRWASEPCLEIMYYRSDDDSEDIKELKRLKRENRRLRENMKKTLIEVENMFNKKVINITPKKKELEYER